MIRVEQKTTARNRRRPAGNRWLSFEAAPKWKQIAMYNTNKQT